MVTIETIKGTPEGVIRTMKITPDRGLKELKEAVKEKTRKFKTLGEINEGFMADVTKKSKVISKKIKKGSTRRGGSTIERLYKSGKPKSKKINRQAAILRERNRQLQLQLKRERMMQAQQTAEQIAAQDRARYERPMDFSEFPPEQPQQEQMQEDDYGRQERPSFFQDMFNRFRPNPGMMNRLGSFGGTDKKQGPISAKDKNNQKQIGTRKVYGMGNLQKEEINVAPRISLLGGNQNTNEPSILSNNQPSFFKGQSSKLKDSLRW